MLRCFRDWECISSEPTEQSTILSSSSDGHPEKSRTPAFPWTPASSNLVRCSEARGRSDRVKGSRGLMPTRNRSSRTWRRSARRIQPLPCRSTAGTSDRSTSRSRSKTQKSRGAPRRRWRSSLSTKRQNASMPPARLYSRRCGQRARIARGHTSYGRARTCAPRPAPAAGRGCGGGFPAGGR
jgi:hypothetical protein